MSVRIENEWATLETELPTYLQDMLVKEARGSHKGNTNPNNVDAILEKVNLMNNKQSIYFSKEQFEDSLKRLETEEKNVNPGKTIITKLSFTKKFKKKYSKS